MRGNATSPARLLIFILLALTCSASGLKGQDFRILERFDCPDASQGVAVDGAHFYAIGNQTITKYTLKGDSVTSWHESDASLIKHFDGGIIVDGLLYCSHSNYPEVPMASSIEVFDPVSMKHQKTISLGIGHGSCTWVVRGEECWYVCFAHYDKNGGEPGKDASWTQIVQYDDTWQRRQGWILPKELVDEIRPNSLSGGLFKDGKFLCTGHDASRLFILEFPPMGMRLRWTGSIEAPIHGQGIAMDSKGGLWAIDRAARQVIHAVR